MSRWRTGRSVGRTLYKDDHLAGVIDSPEDAAWIVKLLNGYDGKKEQVAAIVRDLGATLELANELARAVEAERAHRTITPEMTQSEVEAVVFAVDAAQCENDVDDALRAFRGKFPRQP